MVDKAQSALWEKADRHLLKYMGGSADFVPFIPTRAEGSWLYDDSGRKVLDFTSGQMSSVLGHAHPELVKTLAQASSELDHLFSMMLSKPVIDLAAALAEQFEEIGDSDLQALLAKDPEAKTYPRILITDIPPLRYGPGNHFMVIDETEGFLRGSVVHVLSTVGDWILVARSATAERGEGWLQSALTFSVDPSNVASLGKEVESLKETGHLISVNIDRNEAVVDRYLWTLDTPAVQEGRSRLLAYYVGNSKDSRRWVDIVEQQTGRRIAQYSEAKGLRVY